jgi:hypothetical protein
MAKDNGNRLATERKGMRLAGIVRASMIPAGLLLGAWAGQAAAQDDDAPKSIFFALERRDMPEPCNSTPQLEMCRQAFAELNEGSYGAIRCGYYIEAVNKTQYYSFWFKAVPAAIVALAKNASRAPVKALGGIAVQQCPLTLREADRLHFGQNLSEEPSGK